VIRLLGDRNCWLRPDRARCRSCRRTHILLAWCAPRRADGIEVMAAGAAMRGLGHRPIAADLGGATGTVRGWLRRLRAHAEPLRGYAMGELAWLGGSTGIMPAPVASPLGDALNAVAAAACSGSRNPEIEATSRESAARSTLSARPKLWITLATGLPVAECRSLCASCG